MDQQQRTMIARFLLLIGDAQISGNDVLTPTAQGATHVQPALIAVAVISAAVVAFLGFDFYRQKRVERKEREKLQRFRQRRLAETENKTQIERKD